MKRMHLRRVRVRYALSYEKALKSEEELLRRSEEALRRI